VVGRVRNWKLGDVGDALMGAMTAIGPYLAWNSEVKKIDYTVAPAAVDYSGFVDCLTLIAEGNDWNQRDGHSIKAIALEGRFGFTKNVAASDVMRLIIFIDTEYNGTTPVASDVLQNTASVVAPYSAFQHDNLRRFAILYDETVAVNLDGPDIVVRNAKLKLETHVMYKGTTATAADSKEGQICYLIIGDSNANKPTFSIYTRVSYVDN